MTLIWNVEAENAFSDAAYYYGQQDDGLGNRFAEYIGATIARILSNPFIAHCFDGDCRKIKVDSFFTW